MPSDQVRAIANKLVENCRNGNETAGLDEYYADDAVSVEAGPTPTQPDPATKGLDGIKGKHAWWHENMTVHSSSLDGPFFQGEDRFAVYFKFDAEDNNSKMRHEMSEVGLYTVKDGKIVREEFFYNMEM